MSLVCTVGMIFAFKVYNDRETGVRGHSRSSNVVPFFRGHTSLYLPSIVNSQIDGDAKNNFHGT